MRFKIASIIINLGIRIFPNEYRTEIFMKNIMKTGYIKVERDNTNIKIYELERLLADNNRK